MLHYIVSTSTESQVVHGSNATFTHESKANDTTCSIVAVNNKNYTSEEVTLDLIISNPAESESPGGKLMICIISSKSVGL